MWHCSLSLRADDRKVSASEWGTIAERFVEKMGFIDPDGAKTSRWVAIHHGTSKNGNDHIHVAVQLVREDGTKANTHNDFKRVQEACRELEKEFSLAVVEGRGAGKTLSGYKRAEQERARKAGDRRNRARANRMKADEHGPGTGPARRNPRGPALRSPGVLGCGA